MRSVWESSAARLAACWARRRATRSCGVSRELVWEGVGGCWEDDCDCEKEGAVEVKRVKESLAGLRDISIVVWMEDVVIDEVLCRIDECYRSGDIAFLWMVMRRL